ncbi:MAG: Zinc metalloprotease TldD [Candidatus Woesearchaeota archaeon]|nr:Zinc metalloprotease TldD [Candidatus Woesearchaeota archaeon]
MKQEAKLILKNLIKSGADDVAIQGQASTASQIKYSNSKINATKNWELDLINIFVAKDNCLVSTTLRDLSEDSAKKTALKLMKFVKAAPKNESYRGIAKGPFKYPDIKQMYDPEIENLGEGAIKIVENALNQAEQLDAKRAAGVFESFFSKSFVLTSNNVDVEQKETGVYFSVRGFASKNASGHMVAVSRLLNKFDYLDAVKKAVQIAKDSLNPKPVESGKYDILFDHLPFANLLDYFGNAMSVFTVEAGLSCLEGKIGKNVANEKFDLSDNGTLTNGFNSTKFDEEGVPTKNTKIIDKGVLKTYLHNTSSAIRYDTTTTANAGIVSPSAHNLVLKAGNSSKEQMLSSLKKGIYITNIWYTRFQNYHTGDFSTIPRDGAFLVEDGKIVKPVKDIRITDNLINIMKSVSRLGKKRKQIFGWEVETPVITPMAIVNDVNVTKSEK